MEIPTKDDLERLLNKQKAEILDELVNLLENTSPGKKRWLKNADLMEMLGLSYTGIQNLRIRGLPYTKLGATIYYDRLEIEKLLEENKINGF